jgi:hypothetical protein
MQAADKTESSGQLIEPLICSAAFPQALDLGAHVVKSFLHIRMI